MKEKKLLIICLPIIVLMVLNVSLCGKLDVAPRISKNTGVFPQSCISSERQVPGRVRLHETFPIDIDLPSPTNKRPKGVPSRRTLR